MTNLHQEYYPPIVLLSFAVSFLGAYVGISLAEIFRVKVIDTCKNSSDQGFIHYFYLFLMALSLGGVAIWCMHFIGMQAVSLHHPVGGMVSMEFNFGLSMASLIAVVLTVFVGLVIASRDRMFCKTKTEIIEMFMNDAKQLSIAEIRKITATRMLVLIATKELGTLVAGGVTTSAGVCIMHYVGMASMVFDGQIHWNAGLVALSVVIAMMEWLRMASAFIMALAVNGMHYTGMVAATFVDRSGAHSQGHDLMGATVSESRSFIAVLIVANIVVWLLAHVAFSSSRESVNEKSKRLREAQEVFRRMAEATASNGQSAAPSVQRLLEHYLKKEAKRKQEEEAKALASISHTIKASDRTDRVESQFSVSRDSQADAKHPLPPLTSTSIAEEAEVSPAELV
eukprot:gene13167-9431_t